MRSDRLAEEARGSLSHARIALPPEVGTRRFNPPPPPLLGRAKMGEENWRLMTLCLLTAVVALLMVLSIHLHQDVKYWQVR